jgi:hypothetical protein
MITKDLGVCSRCTPSRKQEFGIVSDYAKWNAKLGDWVPDYKVKSCVHLVYDFAYLKFRKRANIYEIK